MNIHYIKKQEIPGRPHGDGEYAKLARGFLISGREAAEITFDEHRQAKSFVAYVKSKKNVLNATQRGNVVYLWRDEA